MNYADKFELSKASNLLISLIFVNVINYYINKNDNFVCYYFIISTSLCISLVVFLNFLKLHDKSLHIDLSP